MGFERNFDEKIDVVDLIINVLKDHESKLDELVSRLEKIPPKDKTLEIPKTRTNDRALEYSVSPSRSSGSTVTAILKRWADFRQKCKSSQLVTFDTEEGIFKVLALVRGIVYIYNEEIPRMGITYNENENGVQVNGIDINKPELMPVALREKLDCGLEFVRRDSKTKIDDGKTIHKINFEIDPGVAKSWISYQLGINDSDVVQGKLQV